VDEVVGGWGGGNKERRRHRVKGSSREKGSRKRTKNRMER